MATSTGSPAPRGTQNDHFVIHEENSDTRRSPLHTRQTSSTPKPGLTVSGGPTPLSTSKLGNLQAKPNQDNAGKDSSTISDQKKTKASQPSSDTRKAEMQPGSMDALLIKLSEQQAILAKQKATTKSVADEKGQPRQSSSEGSAIMTPASETSSSKPTTTNDDENARLEAAEMARLKKELDAARDQIARQKQELDQSRVIKHTLDQAMGPPSEAALSPKLEQLNQAFPSAANFPFAARQNWNAIEDAHSEISDFGPGPNIWGNRTGFTSGMQTEPAFGQQGGRGLNQRGMRNTTMPSMMVSPPNNYNTPISPRGSGRGMGDFNPYGRAIFSQSSQQSNRRGNGFDMFGGGSSQMDSTTMGGMNPSSAYQSLGMYASGYQPQPIGTPLSPTATEFSATQSTANPWNAPTPASPGQTYVSPMEPLNYRRLLDRSVTCNWKYIVDKIVCNNDQQASIFLQQKLKVGTVEQKYEIIEAIVAQAYPLMVNRFGNFLVQRCFEHGTPEQVIAIANAIRGNTLSLSMDAFGCHVVQKAFDAVPEEYKAIMVHELLRRIPDTVIHRYACHVWQKLFELRWSDSPPQIMKYVNEALRGMWHEVALGETGSLVVQNIFENCLEEDKRPCIDEVLHSIDIVSHGQFGNWCIQHICEHGLPADRSRAIDHVLRYATEYSMDQFASKVVEKCLKIGGPDFLERYLERVCEGRADRPRIPLIDIASDQYGNYLIQFILTHANANHREIVASHIRKHMVSLRGSKFGSRVGMLCCNPAYATHPGPGGAGNGMAAPNRYSSAPAMPRYGSHPSAYR